MPRQARFIAPNYPHHVVQRGNHKENIFDDDTDKSFYLKCFKEFQELYKVKVYAWCLMNNHVHFVVEPTDTNALSLMFKRTNLKYAYYINRKRGTKGQLWEGRFYSSVLEDGHFVNAIKYTELNPFRAYLEDDLGEYKWTSYQERTNKQSRINLTDLPFQDSITNWYTFIKEGINLEKEFELIRNRTSRNFPTGSSAFLYYLSLTFNRDFSLKTKV